MCSIAGYLHTVRASDDLAPLRAMNRALAHRGPDGSGLFVAEGTPGGRAGEINAAGSGFSHRVGLAHNRFSILDPTPAGHQPFISPDGRFTLIFNGEIYNHDHLRAELAAADAWSFRSACDTEVLLAALVTWGDAAYRRLNGFWAAALWDNASATLTLSRDRFGEAPLYVMRRDGSLYFASEIPALHRIAGTCPEDVSTQAVSDYLHHGIIDLGPATFYRSITQLPPAHFARVRPDATLDAHRYVSLPGRRLSERELPAPEAVERFRDALTRAVTLRMRADVPVGFQLSGGLDSSALVALAATERRQRGGGKLSAFTVSYPGTKFDEFPFAAEVVSRFPDTVEHHELRDPGEEFWSDPDAIVARYAEPFSGPNAYTQQLTWHAMRELGIKVVVSGGAADELLAGYRRDFHCLFLRQLLLSGRPLTAARESSLLSEEPLALLSNANAQRLLSALRSPPPSPPGTVPLSTPGSATSFLPDALYPLRPLPAPRTDPSRTFDARLRNIMTDWRMNYWLKIGNISSLAVPIEFRLPFLDPDLADLAFSLPSTHLIRGGYLKWILRAAAAPYLPDTVTWRKRKMGFPFPYSQWCTRSKPAFLAATAGTTNPFIDLSRLLHNWDALAAANPIFLWRCMSVSMWWRRMTLNLPLATLPQRAAA